MFRNRGLREAHGLDNIAADAAGCPLQQPQDADAGRMRQCLRQRGHSFLIHRQTSQDAQTPYIVDLRFAGGAGKRFPVEPPCQPVRSQAPRADGHRLPGCGQPRCPAEAGPADGRADTGLIHADLVRENILLDGAALRFVDFDDGGFGYRLFDLATTLFKTLPEPDYQDLRRALLDGYLGERALCLDDIDLFLALRATSYLGWIVPRMAEPGARARSQRFLAAARGLAKAYGP